MPEEALNSGYVDYVIRAEGEATSVEWLEGLKYKNNFVKDEVSGISWIDKNPDE